MTGNYVGDEWRAPLDDLRALHESLREEEQRVSYWRQLVQGRLDLVRTALEGGHPSADDLASLPGPAARMHGQIDACTAQLVDHCQRDPARIMR